jgi:hypothetical protein
MVRAEANYLQLNGLQFIIRREIQEEWGKVGLLLAKKVANIFRVRHPARLTDKVG